MTPLLWDKILATNSLFREGLFLSLDSRSSRLLVLIVINNRSHHPVSCYDAIILSQQGTHTHKVNLENSKQNRLPTIGKENPSSFSNNHHHGNSSKPKFHVRLVGGMFVRTRMSFHVNACKRFSVGCPRPCVCLLAGTMHSHA
jgi:hypothetical protein